MIAAAIRRGAVVAVSVSGGKDSQAMERTLARLRREQSWPGALFAVHADVGELFDWPWTIPLCERNAQILGHDLHVVRRRDGLDLAGIIWRRVEKTAGTGKPPFPSMSCRYCTSDAKVAPIDVLLRRAGDLVVCAVGLRAEESPGRSKQPVVSVRKDITAERLKDLPAEDALEAWLQNPKGRLALNWNPILEWKIDQVWEACCTSQAELDTRRHLFKMGLPLMALQGWTASPTYMWQSRHSCAICIFGSRSDVQAGATYKPELQREIAGMEKASGFTWQHGRSLGSLDFSPLTIPPEAKLIQPLPVGY